MKHEEGVDILDPEMKKQAEEAEAYAKEKTEKMREVNKAINDSIKELSEDFGLKIYLAAASEEYEEMGIWKSENVNALEEMGLCKLVEGQF